MLRKQAASEWMYPGRWPWGRYPNLWGSEHSQPVTFIFLEPKHLAVGFRLSSSAVDFQVLQNLVSELI